MGDLTDLTELTGEELAMLLADHRANAGEEMAEPYATWATEVAGEIARRTAGLSADVRRWARKAAEATVRRDEAIHAMRAEGASLRAIADAAELSHTAIAKILARHDGAR